MTAKKEFYLMLSLIAASSLIIYFLGREMLSVIISLVFAYLVRAPLISLTRFGLSKSLATSLVVLGFLVLIVLLLLVLLPPMISEAYGFLSSLPKMLNENQADLTKIADMVSAKVPSSTVNDLIEVARHYITEKSSTGLMFIINLLPLTFEVLLYFILVPIMMFFLLRDGNVFADYLSSLMPGTAMAAKQFWPKLDTKLGSYLQGKLLEMLLVFLTSITLYGLFELKYALLMAGLMSISVLIPVFGAILVTLPVFLIAAWQFGTSASFIYLTVGHLVLLALDSNLLVPLLFSEKLALHPVVILIGILFFGSTLGFWGLFFAIPLLIVLHILLEDFKTAFVTGDNIVK